MILILSACDSGSSMTRCIDADDFGFPKARIDVKPHDKSEIRGERYGQFVPWVELPYVTNGQRLVLTIGNGPDSRWSSWGYNVTQGSLECLWEDDNMCKAEDPKRRQFAAISNPPCWFTKGRGLYAILTDPRADPNISDFRIKNPIAIQYWHMGETPYTHASYNQTAGGIDYPTYEENQNYIQQHGVHNPNIKSGRKIYMKIMDNYYEDSWGGYVVIIKSGMTPHGGGPISSILSHINQHLQNAAKNLYHGFAGNGAFLNYVEMFLVLYVIFACIDVGYTARISHEEFMMKLLRVAIVSQLLSDNSWDFFNDHVFALFANGTRDLINIATGNVGNTAQFSAYDQVLGTFFKEEIWFKLWGIMISQGGAAAMFFFVFFASSAVFAWIMVHALLLVVMSTVVVALLITIAPLFISFALFQFTASMLQQWTKMMMAYALQPLMILIMFVYFSTVILSHLQQVAGVTVCTGFPNSAAKFFNTKTWMAPKNIPDPEAGRVKMLAPELHYMNSDAVPGFTTYSDKKHYTTCKPYECLEDRNPQIPFLRFRQGDLAMDEERIERFSRGYYITYNDSAYLFILVFLFYSVSSAISKISKGLAGFSFTWSRMDDIAAQLGNSPINVFARNVHFDVLEGRTILDFTQHSAGRLGMNITGKELIGQQGAFSQIQNQALGVLTNTALQNSKRIAIGAATFGASELVTAYGEKSVEYARDSHLETDSLKQSANSRYSFANALEEAAQQQENKGLSNPDYLEKAAEAEQLKEKANILGEEVKQSRENAELARTEGRDSDADELDKKTLALEQEEKIAKDLAEKAEQEAKDSDSHFEKAEQLREKAEQERAEADKYLARIQENHAHAERLEQEKGPDGFTDIGAKKVGDWVKGEKGAREFDHHAEKWQDMIGGTLENIVGDKPTDASMNAKQVKQVAEELGIDDYSAEQARKNSLLSSLLNNNVIDPQLYETLKGKTSLFDGKSHPDNVGTVNDSLNDIKNDLKSKKKSIRNFFHTDKDN